MADLVPWDAFHVIIGILCIWRSRVQQVSNIVDHALSPNDSLEHGSLGNSSLYFEQRGQAVAVWLDQTGLHVNVLTRYRSE